MLVIRQLIGISTLVLWVLNLSPRISVPGTYEVAEPENKDLRFHERTYLDQYCVANFGAYCDKNISMEQHVKPRWLRQLMHNGIT